jgi:F-type H+-transporting ATPase subunit b
MGLNFGLDATTAASVWATISLVIFIGIVIYFGVPKMITKMLDERIAKIDAELNSATRLREEAQVLMTEYAAKRKTAEVDAANIVAAAKEEAKRLTIEAGASLQDLIARRTRAVEDKIAQAEVQAVAEVRSRSADIAVEAARILLAEQMPEKGGALVDRAIGDVAAKLN